MGSTSKGTMSSLHTILQVTCAVAEMVCDLSYAVKGLKAPVWLTPQEMGMVKAGYGKRKQKWVKTPDLESCINAEGAKGPLSPGYLSHHTAGCRNQLWGGPISRCEERRNTLITKGPHNKTEQATMDRNRNQDSTVQFHLTLDSQNPSTTLSINSSLSGLHDIFFLSEYFKLDFMLPYLSFYFVTIFSVVHFDIFAVYALKDVQNVPYQSCFCNFHSTCKIIF